MHREGKAHRPYEFGVKVSVATPLRRCKGAQFVAHVAALPGNPYDGHTLARVIPAITEQIGVSLARVYADAGYRGHNAPRPGPGSPPRGRNAASPTRSNASCGAERRSNRSSAISRRSIGWDATTWPAAPATPSTP